MFIGIVIDLLREERFDEIGKWCLAQFIIVLVSYLNFISFTSLVISLGCWYCRRNQSCCVQHSE